MQPDVAPGDHTELVVASTELAGQVAGRLWTPESLAPGQPAPLLVVHDGPEYDRLAQLTRFLAAAMSEAAVLPLRVLLLDPGDRHAWYGANPAYARALHGEILPAVEQLAPSGRRVGMGTSLGALAMLHAYYYEPASFAGLFLQSGSFFTPALDPQERCFARFAEVTGFVATVHAAAPAARSIPIVMTCGTTEENLANNRLMAARLAEAGHEVSLHEVGDGHHYIGWRDAFDPCLMRLLRQALT